MTGPAQRSARAALDAARPAVARLDPSRGTEDLAADLVEIWQSIETALRTLVGTDALSGQALIREARQRQLIGFDQANAVAEFEAVHVRLQDTSYRPNATDVNSARTAFLRLEAGLTEASTLGIPSAPQPPTPVYTAPAPAPVPAETPVSRATAKRGAPRWLIPVLGLVLLALFGSIGYMLFKPAGGSKTLADGVTAYQAGQRELAQSDFERAARENPQDPMPHVYLARMAREVGNFTLATSELQSAIQADPQSAVAQREMGANLLQQGQYELARKFYVRAVQLDPNDKSAIGYLGCSLIRLGRTDEGVKFLDRAGAGPWTACAPATPQRVAPGASIPR